VAVGTPTTTSRHVARLWTLLCEAHDWLANDFAEQLAERKAAEEAAAENPAAEDPTGAGPLPPAADADGSAAAAEEQERASAAE
jgi:aromatic-L-amino-acid decarboxylase